MGNLDQFSRLRRFGLAPRASSVALENATLRSSKGLCDVTRPHGFAAANGLANGLLSALSDETQRSVASKLELVPLAAGEILNETGKFAFVYFPLSGSVAKLVEMSSGLTTGAALIGREGVIPLWCFFSQLRETPYRIQVQNEGQALRMTAEDFGTLTQEGQPLRDIAICYQAAFTAQVLQATACNRMHNTLQQYSKWLLMTHDRVGADRFELRQDVVGRMLSVRRMSVSHAAGQLRKQRIIGYMRGNVRILNRTGLEQASCECYRRTRDIYEAILPPASLASWKNVPQKSLPKVAG